MKTESRVAIIVALIGLCGVLGGAIITNWDKIFPPAEPPLAEKPLAEKPLAEKPPTETPLAEPPPANWTLSFRAIDQNNVDISGNPTFDEYSLQVNDNEPIIFDEKTHAESNGEKPEDWEPYILPLNNNVKYGEENIVILEVTSGGSSVLQFDFIRLLRNGQIIWFYGKEDTSSDEFFSVETHCEGQDYPPNISGRVKSDSEERTVDIFVDNSIIEQNSTIFPPFILGPDYCGPKTIRIHFTPKL